MALETLNREETISTNPEDLTTDEALAVTFGNVKEEIENSEDDADMKLIQKFNNGNFSYDDIFGNTYDKIADNYDIISKDLSKDALMKMKTIVVNYIKSLGVAVPDSNVTLTVKTDGYGNKNFVIYDNNTGEEYASVSKDYKYKKSYEGFTTYPGMNVMSKERGEINSMLSDLVQIEQGYLLAIDGDKLTGERISFEIENFRIKEFDKNIENEENQIIKKEMENAKKILIGYKEKIAEVLSGSK